MNLCIYTCFVYLQPFCVTLDFKLFIDPIHILFLLYLLLWFWDFTIKNLQGFIKIYRALIKDIFLQVSSRPAEVCSVHSVELFGVSLLPTHAVEPHCEFVLSGPQDVATLQQRLRVKLAQRKCMALSRHGPYAQILLAIFFFLRNSVTARCLRHTSQRHF